ncbi:MAG: aminotransferase class V-fold PLP-dependent enzyme [Planctomycetota bacterium]|nr:aminotransferase class V-fold PLP-dependent enzyme [Planctomycetota bacterium]
MADAFTLMNPGPINVPASVRAALAASPDQCHREHEYLDMQSRVRTKLVRAFDIEATYDPVLVTGSGTAAMEMMVCSVAGTGMLVLDNGVYGDRLGQMADVHGVRCKRLKGDWQQRFDPAAVRAALEDGIDTIAVVHHETTTGLLNDVGAIAQIARDTGRRLLVDSVSGLAGEAFDFEAIRPDAVCSTANKCIEGLPGVSFVLLRKGTPLKRRSVYLDLGTQLAKQNEGGTPFTPAIQVTAALDAALDALLVETVAGRIARYTRASNHIRATMTALGLELLLPAHLRSNTITCARLPAGVAYPQIHTRMREDGFVLYAGQGDLGRVAFRVANMGQISDERLQAFDAALRRAIA